MYAKSIAWAFLALLVMAPTTQARAQSCTSTCQNDSARRSCDGKRGDEARACRADADQRAASCVARCQANVQPGPGCGKSGQCPKSN